MATRRQSRRARIICTVLLAVCFGLLHRGMALGSPTLSGCPVFPANNVWNTPIDAMPVHPNSDLYIATIGATKGVHPDFGSALWNGGPIGIPYNIVPGSQPKVPITFDYTDESDAGPYPIPPDPAIEGGSQSSGDRHVLVLDQDQCILYETWSTYPHSNSSWHAGSGAIFDMHSNALRPPTWTSSDAAGLPVLPGLVRYDEVLSGEIKHAIRFTAPQTRKEFIWPARHFASELTDTKYPPMGQRFRLKAGFNIAGFAPEVQVILKALKKYGMILADNGASWYIGGVPDPRWNDDILVNQLKLIKGSDFEAIDESSLMIHPNSGEARSGSSSLNPNPPTEPTRLIFIHHSTGENWLSDGNGRLGVALRDSKYFVSDTNYGWGPDGIGSSTDIGHWWSWFHGPGSGAYLTALYNESGQHSSYSRLPGQAPGDENEIILFKSCFPNSALKGGSSDPVPTIDKNPLRAQDSGSPYHTVSNAKGIYMDLLEYFTTRQDKLFIVITAPPLSDVTYASNARAFNQWLVNDWLKDYPYKNVAVFDFYNVLTTNGGSTGINDLGRESGNHHRWWQNAIQHKIDGDNDPNPDVLEYRSAQGDDHPSSAGNLKATGEFVELLNIFYHCWKGTGTCPGESAPEEPIVSVSPASHDFGTLNVGSTSPSQIFAVTDTGKALLALGAVSIKGNIDGDFYESSDDCSDQVLDPSEQCTVSVVFAPTSPGVKTATLNIPSNDPSRPEVSVSLSGKATEPTGITITSPNGGEKWEAGTIQNIGWQFTGNPGGYVKIQLFKNGVATRTISYQAPIGSERKGSYSWSIPANQTPGTDYRIKVTSTKNALYSDMSNSSFSITAPPQPSITVTAPNGGESWQAGTSQTIQWTYSGKPGSFVRILLMRDGRVSRIISYKAPIGTGLFNWIIPSGVAAANNYKIRVMSTTNTSYKDESEGVFSIYK